MKHSEKIRFLNWVKHKQKKQEEILRLELVEQ